MTDPITLAAQDGTPYLAVDVQADTGGRGDFTLDHSLLDGQDVLGYWGSGWLNVVCDVQEVTYRRGATRLQGPLTRAEVGLATVTLRDTERRFDPTLNRDAIHKGTPFRVRAWGYADTYEPVENRRNLVPNPNGTTTSAWFAGSVDGTSVGSYLTGQTDFPIPTAMRYTIVATNGNASTWGAYAGHTVDSPYAIPVTPGQVYSGAMWVRYSVGFPAVRASLAFYNAAGTNILTVNGPSSALVAGVAQRFTVGTATAPVGAVRARVRVLSVALSTVPVGTTFDCTAAQIHPTTLLGGDYFDGYSLRTGEGAAARTHAWAGTPSRSQSIEYAQQFTPMDLWETVLFTGRVDDIAVTYSKDDPPEVVISAADLIADLTAYKSTGVADPGTGGGDNLLERVERVLDEMGGTYPGRVSPDSDADYVATLAPSKLAAAWSDVTAAQDAELGRLWVDNADRLVVRARYSQLTGPIRGTLSDIHEETVSADLAHCCYVDPAVVFGTEMLTNRAVVTRREPDTGAPEPATVQIDDEYSAGRYGLHATEVTTELDTDDQLTPWAQSLIGATTEPELRVDRVTPAPWSATGAWPNVCATDIGDRWAFRLHPSIGPQVARTVGVLGIDATLTPAGWDITWHTTDAPDPGSADTGGWYVLDASTLDEGDLLAPFAGITA